MPISVPLPGDHWTLNNSNNNSNGFTYDQQSEPISPTAGQTWRERSAGGLIIEEWEWSGSVWRSRSFYWSQQPGSNRTTSGWIIQASTTWFGGLQLAEGGRLLIERLGLQASIGDGSISESNTFTWSINFGRYAGLFSDSPVIVFDTKSDEWGPNVGGFRHRHKSAAYNVIVDSYFLHRLEANATAGATGTNWLIVNPTLTVQVRRIRGV